MANKVQLVSQEFVISKVIKPTSAKGMSLYKEGDILTFSLVISNRSGASGGGSYATNITVVNETQETEVTKSQTTLADILGRCFELEEIVHG